jgi:hypothetical protein
VTAARRILALGIGVCAAACFALDALIRRWRQHG